MNLLRLDSSRNRKEDEYPDDHVQSSFTFTRTPDDFPVDESTMIRTSFPRFGRGTERQSDFAVDINWLDLTNLIRKFAEIDHPDALHLKRVLDLVRKVEDAGWQSANEPVEFWDNLLQP